MATVAHTTGAGILTIGQRRQGTFLVMTVAPVRLIVFATALVLLVDLVVFLT